jgi:hypothetical protein
MFINPTTMFRSELIHEKKMVYDEEFNSAAEDMDFWSRASMNFIFANVNHYLLNYRLHPNNTTKLLAKEISQNTKTIQKRHLGLIGIEPNEDEINLHYKIGVGDYCVSASFAIDWFKKIIDANYEVRHYDHISLQKCLKIELAKVISRNHPLTNKHINQSALIIRKLQKRLPLKVRNYIRAKV